MFKIVVMNDWNTAEREQKYNMGNLSLEECKRLGNTHAHYKWANSPGAFLTQEQRDAYNEGFKMYPETFNQIDNGNTQ